MKQENKLSAYRIATFILIGVVIGFFLFLFVYHYIYPKISYKPVILEKEIVLKNKNTYQSETYISINCTDGVEMSLYPDSYYLSTWNNNKTDYGVCHVKYVDLKMVIA